MKKSILMRVDPDFKALVKSLKHELQTDNDVLSDRMITKLLSKKYKKNMVIELEL